MIEIDFSRSNEPKPLKHQRVGIMALVKKKAFFLGDRPRTMKSRQVVEAACFLFEAGLIDLVIVIAPVSGRGVWANAKLGQIKRWSWKRVRVHEYHAKKKDIWADKNPEMVWVVTNYDFIRSKPRLEDFLASLSNYKSAMIVFDESKALGNHTSQQSKAAMRIRYSPYVARCVMLNGTPGNPAKQWSQFNILDHVLDRKYKSFTTFKWQYTEYGGRELKQIVRNGKVVFNKIVHREIGWKNLAKLSKITAPYCLMRERKDCEGVRDIKVVSSFREVALGDKTWEMYKSLRRDALIELENETYVSDNAGVLLLRLSQICSGHLGGFEQGEPVRWFSNEKINWLHSELLENEDVKRIIVWCRWVREREEVAKALAVAGWNIFQVHGGQGKVERRVAEMAFSEGGSQLVEGERYAMVAQPQAGGMALDMSAASHVWRLSNDYNWETFAQSNDRPLGPAQKAEFVTATDVIATGPKGQRTIEHTILEAREENRNLERMTCAEWKKELEAE